MWIVVTAIAGLSFFVVFVEKEIKLRDKLDTEYGLKKKNSITKTCPRSGISGD